MPLNIRSEEVNELAEKLAARKGVTKTAAVKLALESELRKAEEEMTLWEKIRPIRERIAAAKPTGLEADKAFFDSLSGED